LRSIRVKITGIGCCQGDESGSDEDSGIREVRGSEEEERRRKKSCCEVWCSKFV
jgi:hypothetical protein